MPLTFGDLRSALDDLAGVDLDDDQRDDLINEAHRELAVRSEWYRATITIAGVTDQEAYTLPSDVYRILNLRVDGEAYKPRPFQRGQDSNKGHLCAPLFPYYAGTCQRGRCYHITQDAWHGCHDEGMSGWHRCMFRFS